MKNVDDDTTQEERHRLDGSEGGGPQDRHVTFRDPIRPYRMRAPQCVYSGSHTCLD